ncbi:MAG: SRPBCC domain-containing protein [Dehalococcoidia bacterium]
MKPIYTEIIIDSPAKTVWGIITDPDRYPEWNPFVPRITLKSSEVIVGTEFDLDCRMTDSQLLKNEHEVVLEINPDEFIFRMGTSRTRGRPGIVSNRCQICQPVNENRVKYINYEEFRGPLSLIVYLLYSRKLKKAFVKHNLALKARAESISSCGV